MKKVLWGIGGLVVLLFCGAALFLWKRPLAVFATLGRRDLVKEGLARVWVDAPAGRQRAFAGGSGPVLVLLHGAGDQAGAFSKIVPGLRAGRRVLIPDLAGHGESAPAEGPISVETLSASLEAVLAKEAPEGKLTLAGNSLGAWLAALWAVRHPERVERLVFLNGGPLTHVTPGLSIQPKSVEEARKLMDALLDPGSLHPPDFVLADVVREANDGALARFAQTAPTMLPFVLDGRLGTLAVPVDIVWGTSDRLMPLSYAERMLAELPAARLTRLEKCGHVPQVECPARLLSTLDALLKQPPPAAKVAAR